MTPWFSGFQGKIDSDGTVIGSYHKSGDEYVVTELPPGTWTSDYREWLEKELAAGNIKDFIDTSTDVRVHIQIRGIDEKVLVKSLTDKVKTTNMHAFNSKGIITKYNTLNEILKEFTQVRLELYETRRQHQIKSLKDELPYHENVVKFILDQLQDRPIMDLRRKPRAECDIILEKGGLTKIDGGFDYILKLPVSSFTFEQNVKHQKQLDTLKRDIAELEKKTPANMWLDDLNQL